MPQLRAHPNGLQGKLPERMFNNSGIVQQVQAYIAPKLFGGQEAKTPVEGAGVPVPSAAFRLKNSSLTHLGEDILIESEVEYPCSLEL